METPQFIVLLFIFIVFATIAARIYLSTQLKNAKSIADKWEIDFHDVFTKAHEAERILKLLDILKKVQLNKGSGILAVIETQLYQDYSLSLAEKKMAQFRNKEIELSEFQQRKFLMKIVERKALDTSIVYQGLAEDLLSLQFYTQKLDSLTETFGDYLKLHSKITLDDILNYSEGKSSFVDKVYERVESRVDAYETLKQNMENATNRFLEVRKIFDE
ncbi:MAG: hypothetical protein ACK5N8_04800 [Alphaproteobacteria bacterium]